MLIFISDTIRQATAKGLWLGKGQPFETHLKWEAVAALPYAVALGCEALMSREMWGGDGHKACLQPQISPLF